MALVPLVCVGALPTRSSAPAFDVTAAVAARHESPLVPGADVQALLAAGPRPTVQPAAGGTTTVPTRADGVLTTTSTTTARASAAPEVALGPSRDETSTTVAAPSASTTTAPPPATTTTVVGVTLTLPAVIAPVAAGRPLARSQRGQASWFHAPDGTCAHRSLPFGAVVTVTRLYNGASVTCVVDDRGPTEPNRVIDLSYDTFEKLAHPDAGLIEVVIEW